MSASTSFLAFVLKLKYMVVSDLSKVQGAVEL